jgi:hypothetical protein
MMVIVMGHSFSSDEESKGRSILCRYLGQVARMGMVGRLVEEWAE